MPRLDKFFIVNLAVGFALSAVFLGMVLAFDVAGLGHFLLGTPSGWMAGAVVFLANGIAIAGVQSTIAMMGRDGKTKRVPVRVRVESRTERRNRR